MFDKKKAAEYLVVAWVNDWPMWQYIRVVTETNTKDRLSQAIESAAANFSWMPARVADVNVGVRQFVGAAYPKLSAWLVGRRAGTELLKCAHQIERLTYAGHHGYVGAAEREEMKAASSDMKKSNSAYHASRAKFKTHGRSAWNVCKA